ncbi:MAG TPA: diacylglycerol kinase family protein, partial [Candidatus Eisenbacteria bacterium]|nr:diacylglycerol kinase family protein [Candidatus Eisenbacteria bacterium]
MSAVAETGTRGLAFLVNRAAGASRGGWIADRAAARCRAFGAWVALAPCGSLEEARALVRGLGPDAVPVAVGGDGTANLLIRALRAEGMRERAAGLLPAGTGNALAHSLGVAGFDSAVAALVDGVARPVDVLATSRADAPVALVSISTGFEARFLRHLSRGRRDSRLWSAGMGLALSLGRGDRGARIVLDGAEFLPPERTYFTAGLYNMPRYAFGRCLVPEADPRDGLAHAVLYGSARSYWRAWRRGAPPAGAPDVERRAFRRARVESPGLLQVDGESVSAGAMDVVVER